MRTIPEVAEDIKNILNEAERKQECYGETLVKIDELVNEILTINCYKDKPYTNADCIRHRTDEELADFLDDISHRSCSQICIGQCEQIQCEDGILKYLKSKVKGSE